MRAWIQVCHPSVASTASPHQWLSQTISLVPLGHKRNPRRQLVSILLYTLICCFFLSSYWPAPISGSANSQPILFDLPKEALLIVSPYYLTCPKRLW